LPCSHATLAPCVRGDEGQVDLCGGGGGQLTLGLLTSLHMLCDKSDNTRGHTHVV
jgi:hypothetical protein